MGGGGGGVSKVTNFNVRDLRFGELTTELTGRP